MTTPTKSNKTKTPKPKKIQEQDEMVDIADILTDHQNSIVNMEGTLNDHSLELNDLKMNFQLRDADLVELNDNLVHSVKYLCWMSIIGTAFAIIIATVAIFIH